MTMSRTFDILSNDTDWVLDNALGKSCKATGQCVLFLRSLCDVRCACQLPLAVCTVREGLMHLVLSLHLGMCLLEEVISLCDVQWL